MAENPEDMILGYVSLCKEYPAPLGIVYAKSGSSRIFLSFDSKDINMPQSYLEFLVESPKFIPLKDPVPLRESPRAFALDNNTIFTGSKYEIDRQIIDFVHSYELDPFYRTMALEYVLLGFPEPVSQA